MNLKRMVCTSTLAAGVATAGLFGAGLGTAGADPGQCGGPNAWQCQERRPQNNDRHVNGPAPVDWQHRGAEQGRQDHQPFLWNGQRVEPLRAGNGDGSMTETLRGNSTAISARSPSLTVRTRAEITGQARWATASRRRSAAARTAVTSGPVRSTSRDTAGSS
jgi:hypothetical protein